MSERTILQLEQEVLNLMPDRVDSLVAAEEDLIAFIEKRKSVGNGGGVTYSRGHHNSSERDRPRLLDEIKQLTPDRSAQVKKLCDEAWRLHDSKMKFKKGDREAKIEIALADIDSLLVEFGYRPAGSAIERPKRMTYMRGVEEEEEEEEGATPADKEATPADDFEFISQLLEQVGESDFIELVMASSQCVDKRPARFQRNGCTTRDAQDLLGALRRGEAHFSKYADKNVIRMLGDYEPPMGR